MSKAFKKGDAVTFISDWDRKGTVTFRDAIVHSCGKKQMILTDEQTGEEIGRHFKPEIGGEMGGTFPRMTEEEAVAKGLEIAERVLAKEREHFARCLAGNNGESYDNAIRKNIAALHEPRVISYPGWARKFKG